MLSNKSLGIAGVAMLGTVALLGTNAANAAINVSSGAGGIKFALETLDLTDIVVDDDGNRYYRVDGAAVGAGTDDATDVHVSLGIAGEAEDRYSVTYDLSGMALGGQNGDEGEPKDGPLDAEMGLTLWTVTPAVDPMDPDTVTEITITAGRTLGLEAGSNSVTYFFEIPAAASDVAKTAQLRLDVDAFAMPGSGTGSITVTVKNITLADDIGDAKATKTTSMAGSVRVAAVLKEATISDITTEGITRPISRVETDFMSFGDDPFFIDDPKKLVDSIGAIVVSLGSGFLSAADGVGIVNPEDIVDPDESMITYTGDFSFASKVYMADDDDCGGGDVSDSLLMTGTDGAVTNTMSLMPQTMADANGQHICIMVDGETIIPETSRYAVSVDYEGAEDENTRVYPPKGKSRRLAYIEQNGIKITIPYLTTHSGYNQRIVVANLSGAPVEYNMTFHPEAGVEAEGGANAMGEFAEGTTVLSVANNDVVTISGDKTRTAARLIIKADVRKAISVATTQVNLQTGATDTVSYR